MRYLALAEIVELHRLVTRATGGASGIRDLGALEAAIALPKATFDMNDLYPSLVDKAAVLCFSIVQGHAVVPQKTWSLVNGISTTSRTVVPSASRFPFAA